MGCFDLDIKRIHSGVFCKMKRRGMLEAYKALVITRDEYMRGRIDIVLYAKEINKILDEMDEDFLDNCPAVRPDPMM